MVKSKIPDGMMRALAVILAVGFLVSSAWASSAGVAPAQPSPKNSSQSVSAIQKACAGILAHDKTSAPDYVIGRDDPDGGTAGPWQKFATPADLENAVADDRFEDQVLVWQNSGNIAHARITLPAKDWTTVTDYCFQADGTIGGMTSDVENFAVNQIDHREWMFDSKGNLQNISDDKFSDLETKKPVKPERDFTAVDPTIYFKVKNLPFASLLKQKGAQL